MSTEQRSEPDCFLNRGAVFVRLRALRFSLSFRAAHRHVRAQASSGQQHLRQEGAERSRDTDESCPEPPEEHSRRRLVPQRADGYRERAMEVQTPAAPPSTTAPSSHSERRWRYASCPESRAALT